MSRNVYNFSDIQNHKYLNTLNKQNTGNLGHNAVSSKYNVNETTEAFSFQFSD